MTCSDYAKAGYQMMSVAEPAMNARVSLRYSLVSELCGHGPIHAVPGVLMQ